MPRSQEALTRRAKKRGLDLATQQNSDRPQPKKPKILIAPSSSNSSPPTPNGSNAPAKNSATLTMKKSIDKMKEPGAWICTSCGNNNFASRKKCNSKTCSERQPSSLSSSPKLKYTSHLPSMATKWPKQKDMEGGRRESELCGGRANSR